MPANISLKELRQRLGITLRQVEEESEKLAALHSNREFVVSNHWLTRLENSDAVPSVHKLFSLSAIYKIRFSELLSLFGIDLAWLAQHRLQTPSQTYLLSLEKADPTSAVTFPVRFDPGFRVEETNLISRMVEVWGEVPVALLQQLDLTHNQYGYIGLRDYTMYPLLRPGSFVIVDQEMKRVQTGEWRTELDRPIYFVELRDGYACSWCEMDGDDLLLVPHPLSPVRHRRFDSRGAEIIGQVTAIATRITDSARSIPLTRSIIPKLPKKT